jgi:hypothetical protein
LQIAGVQNGWVKGICPVETGVQDLPFKEGCENLEMGISVIAGNDDQ